MRRSLVLLTAGLVWLALSASALAATDSALLGSQTLTAGQALVSADGHYELRMQGDGNLVLYLLSAGQQGRALWSSHTSGDTGDHAVLQRNGNLILVSSAGQTLWSTNTSGVGCANLVVQDDGNLVLYDQDKAVWTSGTVSTSMRSGEVFTAGQAIFSPNEQYELVLRSDGDLILRDASQVLWSTGTRGTGNAVRLRYDGNFVVTDSADQNLWATKTYNDRGDRLVLRNDGNLALLSSAGAVLWASHTGASRAKLPSMIQRPAFQPCPPPTTTVPAPPPPSTPPSSPVVLTPTPSRVPKLGRMHVRMTINWTWDRAVTHLHRITITHLPRHATVTVSCRGHGCPKHAMRAGDGGLRRLVHRLDGHRFTAGNRITIAFSKRRYRTERVGIQIRWGALPKVRLLR